MITSRLKCFVRQHQSNHHVSARTRSSKLTTRSVPKNVLQGALHAHFSFFYFIIFLNFFSFLLTIIDVWWCKLWHCSSFVILYVNQNCMSWAWSEFIIIIHWFVEVNHFSFSKHFLLCSTRGIFISQFLKTKRRVVNYFTEGRKRSFRSWVK